jgi:hypothetical protein
MEQARYANSSGLHPTILECPVRTEQREIMKIYTKRCTTFGEAQELCEQQFQSSSAAYSAAFRRPGTSYAKVAKDTLHFYGDRTRVTSL